MKAAGTFWKLFGKLARMMMKRITILVRMQSMIYALDCCVMVKVVQFATILYLDKVCLLMTALNAVISNNILCCFRCGRYLSLC